MSRRGHKTVNLPVPVCDLLDRIVASGVTTALSRDEAVRQALFLYATALRGRPAPEAWAEIHWAVDELRSKTAPAADSKPL